MKDILELSCLMMTRIVLTIGLVAAVAPLLAGQERAPNGQIYRELIPFVGLDGVRVRISGLEPAIFTVRGVTGDAETAVTGLSRAEHEDLEKAIRSDVVDVFRTAGIPLLSSNGSATETRPELALQIGWARVRPDVITIQVRVDLLEAARLLKEPSRVVWTSSWANVYNSVSSGPDLPTLVRSICRGQVNSFVELYIRAHTRVG